MSEHPKCQYVETGYGDWFTNPVTGTQSWIALRTSEKPCSGDRCTPDDLKDWKETADRWISEVELAFGKDDPAVQILRADYNAVQPPPANPAIYLPFIQPYVELAQRACAFAQDVGPGLPDECDPTQPPPHGYICVNRQNRFVLERDPSITLPPFTPRPIEPTSPANGKKKKSSGAQTAVMAAMAVGVAFGIVALRNRNQ